MSLLSTDEFHIMLYPDRFVLSHLRHEFTMRRAARRMLANRVVPARAGGDIPWSGAVAALETELSGEAGKRSRAAVFLSNHLVRYTLVPWSDALSSEEEEIAATRQCFRNIYGDVADSWELRLSPGKAGAAQLASAVDTRLPDALSDMFAHLGVDMASLQPQLMAVYNANRVSLRDRSAWLLVQEPGSLCLARLQRGAWASVRMLRIGSDWMEELPLILEREAYLADSDELPDEVLLCAPQYDEAVWPAKQRWKLQALQLPVPGALLPKHDECRLTAN